MNFTEAATDDAGRVRRDGGLRIERDRPPRVLDGLGTPAAGRQELAVEVVAVLDVPWWQLWGWRGRAESRILVIDVVTNEAPERRLAATARFFFETRRFDDAIRVAREWTSHAEASTQARLLLGDALAEAGQREAAREAYQHALGIANA